MQKIEVQEPVWATTEAGVLVKGFVRSYVI